MTAAPAKALAGDMPPAAEPCRDPPPTTRTSTTPRDCAASRHPSPDHRSLGLRNKRYDIEMRPTAADGGSTFLDNVCAPVL